MVYLLASNSINFMALARLFSIYLALLKPIIRILLNVYRSGSVDRQENHFMFSEKFSAKHARILLFTNMNEP